MEENSSHFLITEAPTGYIIRWKHNHRAIARYLIDKNHIDCPDNNHPDQELTTNPANPSLFNQYGLSCGANHTKEECLCRAKWYVSELDRHMTIYDMPSRVTPLRQEEVNQYG